MKVGRVFDPPAGRRVKDLALLPKPTTHIGPPFFFSFFMIQNLPVSEIWFVTGSQHLYGEVALKQVTLNSQRIVAALTSSDRIPMRVVFKPVLTTPDQVRSLCLDANRSADCAGLILWMHTFSPAKMWIGGENV